MAILLSWKVWERFLQNDIFWLRLTLGAIQMAETRAHTHTPVTKNCSLYKITFKSAIIIAVSLNHLFHQWNIVSCGGYPIKYLQPIAINFSGFFVLKFVRLAKGPVTVTIMKKMHGREWNKCSAHPC